MSRDARGGSAAPSLVVLVPLRAEAAAVSWGLPAGVPVLRTGMGRERALAAVERVRELSSQAVVVAGVCGAVDPGLRPGDVVVATEVLEPAGVAKRCFGALLLAGALRRQGLRVRLGPIASLPHIAGPEERRRLLGNAIAVDMESAWLQTANGDHPFVVARVVVDTAGRRLRDPRTVVAGARALVVLRRAAPAFVEWGRAAVDRERAH